MGFPKAVEPLVPHVEEAQGPLEETAADEAALCRVRRDGEASLAARARRALWTEARKWKAGRRWRRESSSQSGF